MQPFFAWKYAESAFERAFPETALLLLAVRGALEALRVDLLATCAFLRTAFPLTRMLRPERTTFLIATAAVRPERLLHDLHAAKTDPEKTTNAAKNALLNKFI